LRKSQPELLIKWARENTKSLKDDLLSKKYIEYNSSINSLFGIISLIMGFLVGIGLLSYSGKMPVNVIYYILIVVAVPVISIILSTVAIFTKSNTISNFITLLFPLHWVETISRNLPFKQKIDSLELPFSKKFSKIPFIKRYTISQKSKWKIPSTYKNLGYIPKRNWHFGVGPNQPLGIWEGPTFLNPFSPFGGGGGKKFWPPRISPPRGALCVRGPLFKRGGRF